MKNAFLPTAIISILIVAAFASDKGSPYASGILISVHIWLAAWYLKR